jgi:lipoyl synthase
LHHIQKPEYDIGMRWIDHLAGIEALEDARFEPSLVADMEADAWTRPPRPIRFSTPTFKEYATESVKGCGKNAFPAFSITAGACALDCDHCQAKILEPMIPATTPEMLDRKVRDLILLQDLQGFLLSGGSNRRNEIKYEKYLPVVEKLKRDHPHLKIAIHTAILDAPRAKAMESAGVDTAMMDVIGAQETIRDVYHLDRPVADFEATLAALCATKMEIVPHIVIGLHYGRILGEANALDICARHAIHALVLVVVMPFYAKPGTYITPATSDIGRTFLEARRRLPDRQVLLGCARPAGMHKRVTDAHAVMAGLDGIAFPADGVVDICRAIGRPFSQEHACCSIKIGGSQSSKNGVRTSCQSASLVA